MKAEAVFVARFHQICDVPVRELGGMYQAEKHELALRKRLVQEEIKETIKAIEEGDWVGVLDGIVDSMYVIAGSVVQLGLDPDLQAAKVVRGALSEAVVKLHRALDLEDMVGAEGELLKLEIFLLGMAMKYQLPYWKGFLEVQRSNMTKVDPSTGMAKKDAGGKVMKPEGFSPANLKVILEENDLKFSIVRE